MKTRTMRIRTSSEKLIAEAGAEVKTDYCHGYGRISMTAGRRRLKCQITVAGTDTMTVEYVLIEYFSL